MKPRYLFINENIAGHQTVHNNLAKVYGARHDVTIDYLHVPSASGLRRLGSARVPPLDRWDADLQPLRAQLLAAEWVRRRIARLAESYDALHFYTHNTALLAGSVMNRVPSVVSSDSTNLLNASRIHGRTPSAFTPYAAAVGKSLEQAVYRHARRVTPSSQWVRDSLIEDYHVDSQRIEVNPMGILVPQADRPTVRHGHLRIGFIGSPFDRKGGAWLLRQHAQRWHDRADLLLITTSMVPRGPGIEVVSDLTPGDSRLWTLLASCDVFAFPSAIDQAPNAVLEAMAAWLPVVAVDVGAIGEMVSPDTGFAVAAGDEDAFGLAVDRLLDDDDLRHTMGSAGRQRVETTFNMTRTAERLLQILAEATWERPMADR